jgi:HAD superfamily hydrolase (TIGR01509 family)
MADPTVLFDIDGTLTDTNYLHTVAWRRAFLHHGHDVASARIHRLIGASGSRLMEECIGEADEAVKATWRERFDELIPEIRAFPGARDLITAVKDRGGRVVFATSSPGDLVQHHLAALDLSEDELDGLTTDSDVDEAKPAPDVFLAALDQVAAEADRSIVIGDTGWDIQAAHTAGLSTIAVRTGGWSHAELVEAGAVEVHLDVGTILGRLETTALGDLLALG